MNNTNKQKQNKKSLGFTIVELAVVIVTIGILLSIIVVSYGNWQKSINIATLKSDLAGASSAMENARTFGGVYPSDITTVTTFKTSNGVTLSGGSTDGGLTYCIAAVTSKDITLSYHIDSSTARQGAQTGNCGGMWRQISAGGSFTCAVANNNKIYCWGDNSYGQFGNNTTTGSPVPILINLGGALSGKTIKSISVGSYYTCAIAFDDQAYCWGYNLEGELGNNSIVSSSVPVAVNTAGVLSGKTIKSIATGTVSVCVIASDNQAYCWGASSSNNNTGQLGNNSLADSHVPVAVSTAGVLSGKTIKSIAVGQDHACAIASDNLPYCWGGNWGGGLGNNSTVNSSVPVAVNTAGVLSGKTIKSIIAAEYYTCVIASDDQAYCWGDNSYGELGSGGASSSVPVAVSTAGVLSGKTVKLITASNQYHVCAIASDNLAYCWGYNDYGKVGNNSLVDSHIPVAVIATGVLSGKTIKSISAGSLHTCAIASDDLFYCWGANFAVGQLGNNSTVQSLVPVATVPIP